jgi:AcrR family transcriptional regulator
VNRTEGVRDQALARAVLDAAVARFADGGYHATSVRAIARTADTSPGSLYGVFANKQEILLEIAEAMYSSAAVELDASVSAAEDVPVAKLNAAVWALCDFCTRHPRELRIAESEVQNLPREQRRLVAAKRQRIEDGLAEILAGGAHTGDFRLGDSAAVARALASMCLGIGSWYEPGGSESARVVAETYCDLATRMAGVRFRGLRRARRLTSTPTRKTA